MSAPSLVETLEIARGLTHSTFTQAKQLALVAGIEQAIADNEERHASLPSANTVSDDEIDEDPPELEDEKEAAFQRGLELGRHDALEGDRVSNPDVDFGAGPSPESQLAGTDED